MSVPLFSPPPLAVGTPLWNPLFLFPLPFYGTVPAEPVAKEEEEEAVQTGAFRRRGKERGKRQFACSKNGVWSRSGA